MLTWKSPCAPSSTSTLSTTPVGLILDRSSIKPSHSTLHFGVSTEKVILKNLIYSFIGNSLTKIHDNHLDITVW